MATNTKQIYELAGRPKFATIKLSEPTKVYTGLNRSSIVTQFKAYITCTESGNFAYYINPNARHAFYMPDNVVEFIPIDTMELWYRARKAAEYIKAGRTRGRELDPAFENHDGDEMCAALYRLSLKSKKLSATLYKAVVQELVIEMAAKFENLNDQELSDHAKKTRAEG